MLKKVESYVRKWNMLAERDVVVAGVSGGADSVCLLFVLLALQKTFHLELVVVHIKLQLRGEDADTDEAFVKQLCSTYRIPYVAYHKEVELIAKNRKQSVEEAGRDVRREAFEQTMKQYHGTKLALAHHQNDNAETLLLNLARGTGIRGLGGICPVRENIIRPLLCVNRGEIESYLREQKIPWREDLTNGEDAYARNRIRNHFIPFLEEELNTNAIGNMNRTMEQLRAVWGYMEEETERYYQKVVVRGNSQELLIREEAFKTLPPAIKPMVIHRALNKTAGQAKDIGSVHVETVQRLFEKQTGKRISLPYHLTALRCYEGVKITKNVEKAGAVSDVEKEIENFVKRVRGRVFSRGEEASIPFEKSYTKWFDYDIIEKNVKIRTRCPGDYITIDSQGNTQKLKAYFINEKIPRNMRDHIMLLAEGNHILWVIGHRTSWGYEISGHTKHILEIQIDEGEEQHGRNNSGNDPRSGN
ncbi:MAG: tRNA lysidine(34) synthetase TilS [Lachnospiraceae bacterium]